MTRARPLDRLTPWLLLLAACGGAAPGDEPSSPPLVPDAAPAPSAPTAGSATTGAAGTGALEPSAANTAATPPAITDTPPAIIDTPPAITDTPPTIIDTPPAITDTPPAITFACPGGTIAEGMNTLVVGSLTRAFYAEFPADMRGSIGVVFSWHGFNDPGSDGDAAGWRQADEVDANADPAHPVVVVTPIDVDFEIPVGLDWQFDQPTSATNVDLQFFEAMLGCLHAQYDVDPTRIYSYGFSAGSVMSSLVHSAYPELVSAIACVSGMWFNDQAQVDMIQLIPVTGSWPMLDSGDGGTVLLTHGGPTDITVLGVANLENMAQAAFPFLQAHGRLVVDCPHAGGHVLHPELSTAHVMRFFAEHRAGEPSPYASGELAGYPESCALRLP